MTCPPTAEDLARNPAADLALCEASKMPWRAEAADSPRDVDDLRDADGSLLGEDADGPYRKRVGFQAMKQCAEATAALPAYIRRTSAAEAEAARLRAEVEALRSERADTEACVAAFNRHAGEVRRRIAAGARRTDGVIVADEPPRRPTIAPAFAVRPAADTGLVRPPSREGP